MTPAARAAPCWALALALSACGSDSSGGSATDSGATAQVQPSSVGTEDDPEAFEIALTTQDGEPVEVLAAGTYTLVVSDPAQIHNFHLTGNGVDVATDVGGTGEERFEVTFTAGEYDYTCDPHPSMSGSLRAI
jgi:plastocyanin